MNESPRLHADGVTLAYDRLVATRNLTLAVPDKSFTVIIGPNACGKSTLLRALARMMTPREGAVYLDSKRVGDYPAKELARTLGLLPQSPIAPEGILVQDLVARGRYPHQRLWQQWSREDEAAVRSAMRATAVDELAQRRVDELSGGQRQRVWLALALAQETTLLLLDEPTTFLDIAHQIEVLDLCATLQESGRTLVTVLHDINQACRFATHLVAMRDGRIVAQGDPASIVDAELIHTVFGVECEIITDPQSGTPLMVPTARRRSHSMAPRPA